MSLKERRPKFRLLLFFLSSSFFAAAVVALPVTPDYDGPVESSVDGVLVADERSKYTTREHLDTTGVYSGILTLPGHVHAEEVLLRRLDSETSGGIKVDSHKDTGDIEATETNNKNNNGILPDSEIIGTAYPNEPSHPELRANHNKESIWSSVLFVTPGLRTPILGFDPMSPLAHPIPVTLTQKGISQISDLGKLFRERYIPPSHHHRHHHLHHHQTHGKNKYETDLKGLTHRPSTFEATLQTPRGNGGPETGLVFWSSMFPALPSEDTPTQYPSIQTFGPETSFLIPLDATSTCLSHELLRGSWSATSAFATLQASTIYIRALERHLDTSTFLELLGHNFPFEAADDTTEAAEGFRKAFWGLENVDAVLDYIRHEYSSVTPELRIRLNGTEISREDIFAYLSDLAAVKLYSLYGNVTAENTVVGMDIGNEEADGATRGGVSTIGGAALVSRVKELFQENVEELGRRATFNVMVGEVEQMISTLVLGGVERLGEGVVGTVPGPGSVLAFELFSVSEADDEGQVFPEEEMLRVRLSWMEGNVDPKFEPSDLEPLGLFGRNESKEGVPYTEFLEKVEKIALGGTGDWCAQCGNEGGFCSEYLKPIERIVEVPVPVPVPAPAQGKTEHQMHPAIAGLVGAIALMIVSLAVLLMVTSCCGVKCHCLSRKRAFRRKANVGPEADVGHPKNKVARDTNGVESWELTPPAKAFSRDRDSFDSGVRAASVAERV